MRRLLMAFAATALLVLAASAASAQDLPDLGPVETPIGECFTMAGMVCCQGVPGYAQCTGSADGPQGQCCADDNGTCGDPLDPDSETYSTGTGDSPTCVSGPPPEISPGV